METYQTYYIFKARLNAGNKSELITTIQARDLNEAKSSFQKLFNKNPFYFVFVDSDLKEVYNQHLQLGRNWINEQLEINKNDLQGRYRNSLSSIS